MSSDNIGYRKGRFPKSGIHGLVVSQIQRLKPEVPVHRIDKFGESIMKFQMKIGVPWAVAAVLLLLSFLSVGVLLPLFAVVVYAQLRWGHRGDPNRPDRQFVKSGDLEKVLAKNQKVGAVAVYADALHAVMGASLEDDEYKELATMLRNLLQSEREANARRSDSEAIYTRLSNHDPVKALEQGQADLESTTNAATRQFIEKYISVVENQHERREMLRTQIQQLQAQELLAIELMRSVGESALQLDTIPYVAITPILNNARDLVYEMDHQVLAFERAVVEMEVEPYRLNLASQN